MTRVAIIGSGISGLGTARFYLKRPTLPFSKSNLGLADILTPIIYRLAKPRLCRHGVYRPQSYELPELDSALRRIEH